MDFSHFVTPSLLQNISSAIGISQCKEAEYLMQWKDCLAAVRICSSFRRNLWILCKRMSFSSGDLLCKWKSWIVLQYSWWENETIFDRVMLILLTIKINGKVQLENKRKCFPLSAFICTDRWLKYYVVSIWSLHIWNIVWQKRNNCHTGVGMSNPKQVLLWYPYFFFFNSVPVSAPCQICAIQV